MSTLAGRKILVVGAGTRPSDDPDAPVGNGRAIAVLAARAGASVACADSNGDSAQYTADLVRAEGQDAAGDRGRRVGPRGVRVARARRNRRNGGSRRHCLERRDRGRRRVDEHDRGPVGFGECGERARSLPRVPSGEEPPPARLVDRVHLLGRRSPARQSDCGLRHDQGGAARAVTPRRGRVRQPRHSRRTSCAPVSSTRHSDAPLPEAGRRATRRPCRSVGRAPRGRSPRP